MAAGRRTASARPASRVSALLGLQKVDLFKGLDTYNLREIAAQCRWTRFARNEYIIRRGGRDRDVYFVIAGLVRVGARGVRGRHITFSDLGPGDFFGVHSAIDGKPRVADSVAVRESLVASMSPEVFRAILASHASVRERLLRRLAGVVRQLADRLLDLGAQRVQSRIRLEVLRLARAAGVQDNAARLDPAPTHKEIASRIGTSREEVSREFSRLAQQKLVERSGRTLLLRDVVALEQLAGDPRPEPDVELPPPAAEPREFAAGRPPRERRAILVAEVCDSVALMERDEEGTVERWRAFLARVTAETVPVHAGRSMLRMPADGFVAEFADGLQALRCAFELHQELARANAASSSPPLGLRLGIHVAEVIVETFNVLGDGVNVAACLAELANAGETVISAQVRDQLTSGVDASVEDLGEQRLRNRSRAMRAFRVWPPAQKASPPSALSRVHGRPAIAVIPFLLRSEDARFASIGDSLADETIAAFSHIADFSVISRLSTAAFRHAPLEVRRIGEILGAQYVLSGSVQTAYPRALLVAELADARDGSILWSERFEGDLADVFAMQGEIARRVAASVAPFVRSLELRRARITSFEQLDAYAITLRGVELMHRLEREDFLQARIAFETAINRDPTSPRPHAWLAKWHVMRVVVGASDDPSQDIAAASASAARALGCDADDALALAVDAHVVAWSHRDLAAAEQRLARALVSNPNEPLAWVHSAITHSWRGRGEEAIECAERALSLSPLDPLMYYFSSAAAQANLVGERYDQAVELALRSLRENRLHTPTLRTLAAALMLSGRSEEAREAVLRLRELEPALTVSAFRARYPGKGSSQGERFAHALQAAGLPA